MSLEIKNIPLPRPKVDLEYAAASAGLFLLTDVLNEHTKTRIMTEEMKIKLANSDKLIDIAENVGNSDIRGQRVRFSPQFSSS